MNRFQCCTTPSLTRAHLHDTQSDMPQTLCQSTVRVQYFRAVVYDVSLCQICMKLAREMLGKPQLSAADIGVREIRAGP